MSKRPISDRPLRAHMEFAVVPASRGTAEYDAKRTFLAVEKAHVRAPKEASLDFSDRLNRLPLTQSDALHKSRKGRRG